MTNKPLDEVVVISAPQPGRRRRYSADLETPRKGGHQIASAVPLRIKIDYLLAFHFEAAARVGAPIIELFPEARPGPGFGFK